MSTKQQGAQVQKVVTSGTFSLDGGTWEVDNNVWVYGDEDEVVVVDAAHDAQAIAHAIRWHSFQPSLIYSFNKSILPNAASTTEAVHTLFFTR